MKYKILKTDSVNVTNPNTNKSVKVYRIIALKTFETVFGVVTEGSIGGYIQSESVLSQTDHSWVFNTAKVFGNAILIDSAVARQAHVFGDALLKETLVTDSAIVYGNCELIDCEVRDRAKVMDSAKLESVYMINSATAKGYAVVKNSKMDGGCLVGDNAVVLNTTLLGSIQVIQNANLDGCALTGHNVITGTMKGQTVNYAPPVDLRNQKEF